MGIGRGLLGAFTKPVGGTLEFLHKTSEGLLATLGVEHLEDMWVTENVL